MVRSEARQTTSDMTQAWRCVARSAHHSSLDDAALVEADHLDDAVAGYRVLDGAVRWHAQGRLSVGAEGCLGLHSDNCTLSLAHRLEASLDAAREAALHEGDNLFVDLVERYAVASHQARLVCQLGRPPFAWVIKLDPGLKELLLHHTFTMNCGENIDGGSHIFFIHVAHLPLLLGAHAIFVNVLVACGAIMAGGHALVCYVLKFRGVEFGGVHLCTIGKK